MLEEKLGTDTEGCSLIMTQRFISQLIAALLSPKDNEFSEMEVIEKAGDQEPEE